MLTGLAVQQKEAGSLKEANMIKQLNIFSPWISLLWKETLHSRQGVMVAAFPLIGKGPPLAS